MAQAKVGSFTLSGSLGTQQITTVGFKGEFAFFWWNGTSSTTDDFEDSHAYAGIGVAASSTARGGVGIREQDDSAITSEDCTVDDDDIIVDGTFGGQADFVQFLSNGFEIDVQGTAKAGETIFYLVVEGIPDIAIGARTAATSLGTEAVSSVTSFTPTGMMFLCSHHTQALGSDENDSSIGLGFASGSAVAENFVVAACGDNNSDPQVSESYVQEGECLAFQDPFAPDARAKIDSFNSDGFTLDWLSVQNPFNYIWVAFGGIDCKAGTVLSQTSTGTWDETGVGFQPVSLILASASRAESTAGSSSPDMQMGVGATDGTTEHACGYNNEDGASPPDTNRWTEFDALLVHDTPGQQAIDGEISLDSFLSDGFRLNQVNADGSQFMVGYFAMGANTLSAPVLSEHEATDEDEAWLEASSIDVGATDLEWQRAPDVSGSPGTWGASTNISTPSDPQAFRDNTVSSATKYWFRAKVTDDTGTIGDSDWSNELQVQIPYAPPTSITVELVS